MVNHSIEDDVMNRKQIIREKYVLKQLLKLKSPQSISLSCLSESTKLDPKSLQEIIIKLITKKPQIGSYNTRSGELHLVRNSYQEIDKTLKSYPKPYYEYIPLIKDNRKVTEEEFQYVLNELSEKIKNKLRVIVALPITFFRHFLGCFYLCWVLIVIDQSIYTF